MTALWAFLAGAESTHILQHYYVPRDWPAWVDFALLGFFVLMWVLNALVSKS